LEVGVVPHHLSVTLLERNRQFTLDDRLAQLDAMLELLASVER
jgi:hypothetical protein